MHIFLIIYIKVCSNSDLDVSAFFTVNWTNEEKTILLESLKKHGVNISIISDALPHKSPHEIRATITRYENLALQSLTSGSKKDGDAPLDKWIKILQQHSTRNNQNLVSRVLKYIALFEKRQDHPVNLKDCYLMLSDLTSGKPTKEMDVETTYFLNECFSKLARDVREDDIDEEIEFLEQIEFSQLNINKTYQRKNTTSGIETDRVINVCKVPTALLKD